MLARPRAPPARPDDAARRLQHARARPGRQRAGPSATTATTADGPRPRAVLPHPRRLHLRSPGARRPGPSATCAAPTSLSPRAARSRWPESSRWRARTPTGSSAPPRRDPTRPSARSRTSAPPRPPTRPGSAPTRDMQDPSRSGPPVPMAPGRARPSPRSGPSCAAPFASRRGPSVQVGLRTRHPSGDGCNRGIGPRAAGRPSRLRGDGGLVGQGRDTARRARRRPCCAASAGGPPRARGHRVLHAGLRPAGRRSRRRRGVRAFPCRGARRLRPQEP